MCCTIADFRLVSPIVNFAVTSDDSQVSPRIGGMLGDYGGVVLKFDRVYYVGFLRLSESCRVFVIVKCDLFDRRVDWCRGVFYKGNGIWFSDSI